MEAISFGAAFLAGVVSFVSPCVLPMLPTFVLILAGSSNTGAAAAEGGASSSGSTLARNVLAFLLGFAVVFLALGATATVLGRFLLTHLALVEKAGAVLLALLGLFLSGIISPSFLYREWRPFLHRPSEGALGSFLLGMSFTVGWTPCPGPILAAILIYAGIMAARRVPAAGAVDGESRTRPQGTGGTNPEAAASPDRTGPSAERDSGRIADPLNALPAPVDESGRG